MLVTTVEDLLTLRPECPRSKDPPLLPLNPTLQFQCNTEFSFAFFQVCTGQGSSRSAWVLDTA